MPVPVRLVRLGVFDALLANEAVADAAPDAPGVNVTMNGTGVPVVTVTGKVMPLMANSEGLVPPNVTEDTVTLAPLAVRVPVAVPLAPTTTLPTATGELTLSVPTAAVPVPVRLVRLGVFDALLANEAVADAAPDAPGVNVTVNITGVLVVTVTGKVTPLMANSEGLVPPNVTEDTVTLAPLAVRVPVAVPLAPTTTLPTATGELTLSVPTAAVPVPVRLVRLGVFDALLANEAVADAAPDAPGVNVTMNGTGVPVVTVTGKVMPLMANSEGLVPPNVTEDTVTLAPLAVRVPVAVPLAPTTTLPTATGELTLSVPTAAVPVPVRLVRLGVFDALLANEAVADAAPDAPGVNVTVNITGVLVVTVTGKVTPLMANSEGLVPPNVTEDTVTLAPLAVRVPVAVPLAPTTTLPTATGELTLSVPTAAVPVPVRLVRLGVFDALLANEAVADAAPDAPGVNVTVNFTGVLVVTVTGKVTPLMANSPGFVPPKLTEDTVTLAPLAVRVPVAVPLAPTTTLPTATGELTLRVPTAAVPVPVRLVRLGVFDALLANEAVADAAPEAPGVNVTVNFTGVLVVTVTGKVTPLMANSPGFVPPKLTEDTVTLAPLAVRVPVAVPLAPTTTLPTATGELTLRVPTAAVPVPVRLVRLGVFDALLANEAVADAAPEAPGVNVTVNGTGVLVVTVTGKVTPLMANSPGLVPPKLTEDTVTLAPLAVRVPVAVPLAPTTTLPTATGELTLSVPAAPLPFSGIVKLGFDASDVMETLPLKLPADDGVKVTLNDVLCPGVKVSGVLIPTTLNPVPLAVAAEIAAFTPPVFFTVSVWV